MENVTHWGPLLYLAVAWGIITGVLIILLIYRSILSSKEEDQLFLDAAEEHMAKEQRQIRTRVNPPVKTPPATGSPSSGAHSGALSQVPARKRVVYGTGADFGGPRRN